MMMRLMFVTLALAMSSGALAQSPVSGLSPDSLRVLPSKNSLALTPENFCLGVSNTLKTSKQNLAEQAAILCDGVNPTAQLRSLLASPYRGTGQVTPTQIRVQELQGNNSEILVAFSMQVPKTAVQALIGEEKHAAVPYDAGAQAQDRLYMDFKFLEPPENANDCDTAFTLEQLVRVRTVIQFDDTTKHELKLYRIHPNNFDFFMAGRTLTAPSQTFSKSVVMRGFMTDASDPSKTLSVTVLHFVMNNRQQHDRMVAAFLGFIRADIAKLFAEQSQ